MPQNQISISIRTLQIAFDGQPWYGISAMEKLKALHWQYVNLKPSGSSKSIAILLGHMIRWRVFVLEKIAGNADFDIEMDSEENWPNSTINSEAQWHLMLDDLKDTQQKLVEALSLREDDFLKNTVPGKPYDFRFMINGISEHDTYHLGQIALLYTLVETK